MTPRIEKAIDVFLDAINNGTLAKGKCTKCAVGNLVTHGMIQNSKHKKEFDIFDQEPYISVNGVNNYDWNNLFLTHEDGERRLRNWFKGNIELGLKAISYTDFTEEELSRIEYTFETSTLIHADDYYSHTKEEIRQDQIKGLEAVVKVMLEFDECKDEVQEVFTSKAELIPIV